MGQTNPCVLIAPVRREEVVNRVMASYSGFVLLSDGFVIELAAYLHLGKYDDRCHLIAEIRRKFIGCFIPDLDAVRADGHFLAIMLDGVGINDSLLGAFAIEIKLGLPMLIDPLLCVYPNHPLVSAFKAAI